MAVAAEGDEQPCKTLRKTHQTGPGEAKPEAVLSDGVVDVPELAIWLMKILSTNELNELMGLLDGLCSHSQTDRIRS